MSESHRIADEFVRAIEGGRGHAQTKPDGLHAAAHQGIPRRPVVEVRAQSALADRVWQVTIRRRADAHVRLDRPRPAKSQELVAPTRTPSPGINQTFAR